MLPVHLDAQDAVPTIAIPRPDLFPDATNPAITLDNIGQNICSKGWSTKSIRPPTSCTNALRKTQLRSLDYTVPNPLARVKTKPEFPIWPPISIASYTARASLRRKSSWAAARHETP